MRQLAVIRTEDAVGIASECDRRSLRLEDISHQPAKTARLGRSRLEPRWHVVRDTRFAVMWLAHPKIAIAELVEDPHGDHLADDILVDSEGIASTGVDRASIERPRDGGRRQQTLHAWQHSQARQQQQPASDPTTPRLA